MPAATTLASEYLSRLVHEQDVELPIELATGHEPGRSGNDVRAVGQLGEHDAVVGGKRDPGVPHPRVELARLLHDVDARRFRAGVRGPQDLLDEVADRPM